MDKMEISKGEYERLLDSELKLNALENGGVDNWQFYDVALEEYNKEKDAREKIEKFTENLSDEILECLIDEIEFPAGREAGPGIRVKGAVKIHEAIESALSKLKVDWNSIEV